MSRLNVVLALMLVVCALAVIQSQHRARSYFVELERLKKEARVLDEQWGQLQLEQGTWANPARVDTLARTRLGLVPPPPERIHLETGVAAKPVGAP
ncbi:MAG: cell division protein FtsL [Gammaproteobacteria bacterium]